MRADVPRGLGPRFARESPPGNWRIAWNIKSRAGQGKFMGSSINVRPSGAGLQGGAPATLAFRRPADSRVGTSQDGRWDVPVQLRLPDVTPSAAAPASQAAHGSNPLVGQLMWVMTGVLAIVAIWLVATGNPDRRQSMPEAPNWRSSEPAPPASDARGETPVHRPVPNWKEPPAAEASAQGEPAGSRGPWRAGAQIVQPGAASENELAPSTPAGPSSAAWPGDAWPGHRPDIGQPPEGSAAPGGAAAGNPAETAPSNTVAPSSGPASTDPWPGDPRWPDDARGAVPADGPVARTAQMPPRQNNPPPASGPAARLNGGIQQLDVNSNHDGTRSRFY